MKLLSTNLIQIASILSDMNYHDGDSIGLKLGITRSAVWKNIKKLEEYGVEVMSVKNKGYALKAPLLLIDQAKIVKELDNLDIRLEVFEDLDSSNNFLKNNIDAKKRRICFAEAQNKGRGRMGGFWYSPFGQNIHMSYCYHFNKDISELNGLSLVVGVGILKAIKEIGIDADVKLKWPNDGNYLNQKLIGILVELQSEAYGESTAVVGIGINVNMLCDKGLIDQSWTSLNKITGKYIDRNVLAVALIHNLNYVLERFAKYGLREFLNDWRELDSLYNKSITLNNGQYFGIAKGINEHGNLVVELASGELRAFSSGEVSISKH
jgi:BirA family biotin operon repressor/biotin-[acetyl-CoA-carboxylase] ligase